MPNVYPKYKSKTHNTYAFSGDDLLRHRVKNICILTLSLLMSLYMELLVKPAMLTSYIYGPTFGNAESCLFLVAAQCFNTESVQEVILWHSCV
jgi:hypothetical protein